MWTRRGLWYVSHLEKIQACSEEQVAELDGLLLQQGRLSLDDGDDGHADGTVAFRGS